MLELLVFAAIVFGVVVPVYVLGRRREVEQPWVAFIPILGVAAVLFKSIGQSGWLALMAFVPFGSLVAYVWIAVEAPAKHGRSRWWTLPLLLPLVNVIAWWFYAFTLPRREPDLAFA